MKTFMMGITLAALMIFSNTGAFAGPGKMLKRIVTVPIDAAEFVGDAVLDGVTETAELGVEAGELALQDAPEIAIDAVADGVTESAELAVEVAEVAVQDVPEAAIDGALDLTTETAELGVEAGELVLQDAPEAAIDGAVDLTTETGEILFQDTPEFIINAVTAPF